MNILVIGNGFDLAQGLPTKYLDFLGFVKVIRQIIKKCNVGDIDWGNVNIQVKELIMSNLGNERNGLYSQEKMWNNLISNNFWIDYFLQCDMHGKENWIDFESEISEVIQSLDDDMHGLVQIYNIEDTVYNLTNGFLKNMYSDYIDAVQPINPADNGFSEGISFKEIRDTLLSDLNRLIRAFEIYLTEYIEKINVKVISPDIEEIVAIIYDDRGQKGILFSKVISFNYTNIYEQIYLRKYNINCNDYVDYIHGKADIIHTIETNNMVLGIDEHLSEERRDKEIDFIAFKKFYQRIYKGTGCKYKDWVDKIQEDYLEYLQKQTETDRREKKYIPNNMQAAMNRLAAHAVKNQKCRKHNLYIFGHSLDITDRDILRDLILNDNVYTTIFYHSKDTMGQQIANLVKVIGQDELIRRTGGSTKTIEFKLQQDMTPIDN